MPQYGPIFEGRNISIRNIEKQEEMHALDSGKPAWFRHVSLAGFGLFEEAGRVQRSPFERILLVAEFYLPHQST